MTTTGISNQTIHTEIAVEMEHMGLDADFRAGLLTAMDGRFDACQVACRLLADGHAYNVAVHQRLAMLAGTIPDWPGNLQHTAHIAAESILQALDERCDTLDEAIALMLGTVTP